MHCCVLHSVSCLRHDILMRGTTKDRTEAKFSQIPTQKQIASLEYHRTESSQIAQFHFISDRGQGPGEDRA